MSIVVNLLNIECSVETTDSNYNKFRSIQLDMQYLINSQVFSQIFKSNEMYINISKIILTAIYLVGVEVLRSAVFSF